MKDVRRQRLKELLASRFDGNQAALARAAQTTRGRITQLLNDSEPFGDLAATNLEKALGLPAGYLNGDISPEKTPAGLTPAATELALLFDLIPTENRVGRAVAYANASRAILDVVQVPPADTA